MTDRKTRIGVILSAGGSAFAEAARIAAVLPIEFRVVTDRECGAEARCRALGIPVTRIAYPDRTGFSLAARDHFAQAGVQAVLLMYSRLIGPELFRSIPCCNIHPALLPSFPGLDAVKQAWAAGVRFLGATLHVVDETTDMGPIVAQTVDAIPLETDLAWCEHLSFLQKTLLALVLFELIAANRLRTSNGAHSFDLAGCSAGAGANPTLSDQHLLKGFESLRSANGGSRDRNAG